MFSSFLIAAVACNSAIDIRQFGAVGDGKTMSTRAIQRAIDAAVSTKTKVVLIPEGQFLTGTLHLRSHTELRLQKDAVLLGSTSRKDYDHGVWYGLLMAANVEDIAITGQGTVDGQGAELAQDVLAMVKRGEIKIPPKGWRPSEIERPQIIEITNCQKVRVEDVTIKNACCWVQTYRRCTDLRIKGIKVDSKTYWNNDGIDVVDCKKVLVSGCDVDAADDGICLKSETKDGMCEDVVVEDCKIRSSASAIKFGTASQGGFRHIRIRRISIRNTFRSAVALESVDGGILEDVEISGVKAVNTGNAFFIRLGHRNLKVPAGHVRHVVLRDFDVQVPAGRPDEGYPFHGPIFTEPHNVNPSSIVGLVQAPIEDVRLERIKIQMPGAGTTAVANSPLDRLDKVPVRAEEYPEFSMFGELPAWALYARYVHGLKIRDFHVVLDRADYRPAFVADAITDLSAHGVKVLGARHSPVFVLKSSARVSIGSNIDVHRMK